VILDKKEKIMRDIDSDEDNLCSHDKYYEDCDECCINESDDDDGKCHFNDDETTGCGTLIYQEDGQNDGYNPHYFIGVDSFKFCPICGKEISFYYQEPAYIAKQFELEVERKEKERIEKETEEKRRAAVKKYKMEIEKNTRGEERMIEESRLNKKRVDYINTYGINSFEKLTEAEKEKLF
jgi:uncharacterized Zn finger protein (UPF0148 family)